MTIPAWTLFGQSYPNAGTPTMLYKVPRGAAANIQLITVCNHVAGATTFKISVRPDGAIASDEQFLYYDMPINGNATTLHDVSTKIGELYELWVEGANGDVSFNAFGEYHFA